PTATATTAVIKLASVAAGQTLGALGYNIQDSVQGNFGSAIASYAPKGLFFEGVVKPFGREVLETKKMWGFGRKYHAEANALEGAKKASYNAEMAGYMGSWRSNKLASMKRNRTYSNVIKKR